MYRRDSSDSHNKRGIYVLLYKSRTHSDYSAVAAQSCEDVRPRGYTLARVVLVKHGVPVDESYNTNIYEDTQ